MKVAIIHPWFPQYRVAFFEGLVEQCAAVNIDLRIFYGDPPPEWSGRNDARTSDGFKRLPTRFLAIRGRTLNFKSLAAFKDQGPFDLVILEQAVRNLETYWLLLEKTPLAYWGHGKTYTLGVSPMQERVKQWLTRKGLWFFAYTNGGVEAVVDAGFDRSRTTVVQNSIDTTSLRDLISSVEPQDVNHFEEDHGLRGKTALFIGGLDSSKRIGFLLASAEIAHGLDPDFRLLIVGAGADRPIVDAAVAKLTYVIYLGSLFGHEKALVMRAADVIAMPGRVGLVSVDSFAACTPIVTTNWPWHAPEFEYLESGVNAVVTPNQPDDFARGLVDALQDTEQLARLRAACRVAGEKYTVESMIDNFVNGLKDALEGQR